MKFYAGMIISINKQVAVGVICTLLVALSGLFFTQYYVTSFGKEQYSLISLMLAVVAAILNLNGLQNPLVAEYSRIADRDFGIDNAIRDASTFSVLIGLFAVVIFGFALFFLDVGLVGQWMWYVSIGCGVFIFIFFLATPYKAYLIHENKSYLLQVWKLIVYGSLFFLMYVISRLRDNSPDVFSALVISSVVGYVFILIASAKPILVSLSLRTALRRYSQLFTFGLMLNGSLFLFLIIDKLFLRLLEREDAADYLIAYELILKVSIIHGIVGTVLLGNLSRKITTKEKNALFYYHCYAVAYIGFTAFLAVYFFLYSGDFFELWLHGQETEVAIDLFQIFVVSFILNGFGWLGFNVLILRGQLSRVAKLYLFLPMILTLSCLVLTREYGAYGIAFSVVFARLVDVAVFSAALNEKRSILKPVFKSSAPLVGIYVCLGVIACLFKGGVIENGAMSASLSLALGALMFGTSLFAIFLTTRGWLLPRAKDSVSI